MTVQHPRLAQWEKALKTLLDEVDDALENRFGDLWRLHPARPERGATANKAHDGLFDITANFSLGLGSTKGRGYAIDIHVATLETLAPEERLRIEDEAQRLIAARLTQAFPGRELFIDRDGPVLKLHGDLSLGPID